MGIFFVGINAKQIAVRRMSEPFYPLNWTVGWTLVLLAFTTGAWIGLYFHEPDFWGGYDSFRRRIVRLGHIAMAALGMMNVIYSLSPWPAVGTTASLLASWGFVVGGISMPAVCFLSGWRKSFRHLFFIPVVSLVTAAASTIAGALR
jgi:hypothetical protein